MLTPTNVIPSTSVNGISSTTTWIDVAEDPRSLIDFDAKAKALKILVASEIRKKLNELPINLAKILTENYILSGSSIASIYHGEQAKDYDLWVDIATEATATSSVKRYIAKNMAFVAEYQDKYGDLQIPDEKRGQKVITDRAITLTNGIQIITMGSFSELRRNFDFVHCLPYYVLYTDKFFISPLQMEVISKKKLVQNIYGQQATAARILKFTERGWGWSKVI